MRRYLSKCYLYLILLLNDVLGDIVVYNSPLFEQVDHFIDLPALFGPTLPPNGLRVEAVEAYPRNGCSLLLPPPPKNNLNTKYVAVIARNTCPFEDKVLNAQKANFDAVIVYNIGSDELEQMSARNGAGIKIPSVFVGETAGNIIMTQYKYSEKFILVLNDELPFNINTHLILPFSILVGLCFIIMIVYMIYKCLKEQRRLRRHRLPKSLLKKIPIVKFAKGQPYESCIICLEDYKEGEKLRVLPCSHAYHSQCIDVWLTKSRRVCPICKRKLFHRRDPRNERRRHNSTDSLSDSETDDTSPLLNHGDNANNHGTFIQRQQNVRPAYNNDNRESSDDESVLSQMQSRRMHESQNSRRVNPFDRVPNIPPNLLHDPNNRMNFWRLIARVFRRTRSASLVQTGSSLVDNPTEQEADSVITISVGLPQSRSLNNVLNRGLNEQVEESDVDDDEPIQNETIYESACSDPNISNAVYIDTPVRGRLGVVALPNTDFDLHQSEEKKRVGRNKIYNA